MKSVYFALVLFPSRYRVASGLLFAWLYVSPGNFVAGKPQRDPQKSKIIRIAEHIIEKREANNNIWNLFSIDTAHFYAIEDHFTSVAVKTRLILFEGEAGLSAGTANRLLILFDDKLKVIWSGQTGPVSRRDIIDVTGDGIKEIVFKTTATWMGTCFDGYRICNFKNGRFNTLYSAESTSSIDCGMDNLADRYKTGDTLEVSYDCTLVKKDSKQHSSVKQVRTIGIFNGGKTDEEVQQKMIIVEDSTIVKF